jgi:hypothetical protein
MGCVSSGTAENTIGIRTHARRCASQFHVTAKSMNTWPAQLSRSWATTLDGFFLNLDPLQISRSGRVPSLQGGRDLFGHLSQAFSLGYYMPGLQPFRQSASDTFRISYVLHAKAAEGRRTPGRCRDVLRLPLCTERHGLRPGRHPCQWPNRSGGTGQFSG